MALLLVLFSSYYWFYFTACTCVLSESLALPGVDDSASSQQSLRLLNGLWYVMLVNHVPHQFRSHRAALVVKAAHGDLRLREQFFSTADILGRALGAVLRDITAQCLSERHAMPGGALHDCVV